MKYTIKELSKYLDVDTMVLNKIYTEMYNEVIDMNVKLSFNKAYRLLNEVERRGL